MSSENAFSLLMLYNKTGTILKRHARKRNLRENKDEVKKTRERNEIRQLGDKFGIKKPQIQYKLVTRMSRAYVLTNMKSVPRSTQ